VAAVLASSATQANCRNLRKKHISLRFSRLRAARRGAQRRAIRIEIRPKKENAPRRWLPRPASRLTFAEASADRETINLRCSYLGATTTVDGPSSAVKSDLDRSCRKLRLLYLDPCGFADRARCSRKSGPGVRRAGTPSSTSPADSPLARTAARRGFVLRCPVPGAGWNLCCGGAEGQAPSITPLPQIANVWRRPDRSRLMRAALRARRSTRTAAPGWADGD